MDVKWFPKDSLRRLVAGNVIFQLIGRIISSISVIILSLIIAKQYGPVGYGDFVKITTFVGFFYLFADFGLNAIYLQYTANDTNIRSENVGVLWRKLLGVRLGISGVLILIAIGLLACIPQGFNQGYTPLVRLGILVLLPMIIAQSVTTTVNGLFQKMLRYKYASISQITGSFVLVIITLFLSSFTHVTGSLLGVFAVLSGGIITAGVGFLLACKSIGSVTPHFDRKYFFLYLKDALPLGLALIFNLIYFHADSVILTLTRSTSEVGIYGLAYKLFELPLVLPIFFMNSVYPLLLKTDNEKPARVRSLFFVSFLFLLVSSIGISIVLWIGAPFIPLIRPDFAPSIEPFRVLLLGLPVFFISGLCMWFIIAQKKQKALVFIHGGLMVANIIANIIFVPRHGYMASAWITIASETIVLFLSVIVVAPYVWRGGET